MSEWEKLENECKSCQACALSRTRKNVVFGVGSREAEVLFIGRGPGPTRTQRACPSWAPPGSCWTICCK